MVMSGEGQWCFFAESQQTKRRLKKTWKNQFEEGRRRLRKDEESWIQQGR